MANPPEHDLAGANRDIQEQPQLRAAGGAGADPAEIRAIAFAASLGPQRPPHSSGREDIVIDLAGEEALVEFLMRITPVDISD